MRTRLLAVLLLLLLGAGLAAQRPLDLAGLWTQLTDEDRLWQPAGPGETIVVASSRDRRSDQGPEVPDDWFADEDAGRFVRVDLRDQRPEYVLVDTEGPGALVRLWVAQPSGRLSFYLDGAEDPAWQVDLAALVGASPALGLVPPLAAARPGGAVCRVPIPFGRRLVVAASDPRLQYEVVVRRLPDLSVAGPWSGPAIEAALPALAAAAAAAERMEFRADASSEGELLAGVALEVAGPRVLRELRIELRPADGVSRAVALRRTLLVLAVDGAETARVPLGDFFAAAPDAPPFQSRMLEVLADGTLCSRWPIPLQRTLRVQLAGEGEGPLGHARIGVRSDAQDVPAGAWTLHAAWHHQRAVPARPFREHRLLDTAGPGRVVGLAVAACSTARSWWGDGDPKWFVDGAALPDWFGTATDAHFGFTAGRTPRYCGAFGGILQHGGPGSLGTTTLLRLQLGDDLPFTRSVRGELEILQRYELGELDLATTVWWYAPPGAVSGLPPIPPVGERLPREITVRPPRRIAGALEAESLPVLGKPKGRVLREEMSAFDGDWSDGAQLAWRGAEPGDRLELGLPVPAPGKYRLRVVFTQAPDQGQITVHLGGKELPGFFDLHGARTRPGNEIDFGIVELGPGQTALAIELIGRDVRARPDYGVGLDYVKLEPIK